MTEQGVLGLYEWQSPGCDWELITFEELTRRMGALHRREIPGPVSHAYPPGTLSGINWKERA